MKPVKNIPIFNGQDWSSIRLAPRETEAATTGERQGFVVVDQYTRRLGSLWFFWCEARNRPSIVVAHMRRGRAEVSIDLHCTDRCFRWVGWEAVVEAYARHGSREMVRRHKLGLASGDYAHGAVPRFAATQLACELLAIVSDGSFVAVCHRPPVEVSRR